MRALTLILALVLLAACGSPPTRSGTGDGPVITMSNGVAIIRNSPGGNVQKFLNERARLAGLRIPLEIHGYCNSSCTIFYSLPTACMAVGSRLGFHATSGDPTGYYSRMIRSKLRAGIADMYWSTWRHSRTITSIRRAEAMQLDPAIRACETL